MTTLPELALPLTLLSLPCLAEQPVFPHRLPEKKPHIPLSAAMERMFGVWHKPEIFFTQGLSKAQREQIAKENRDLMEDSR